MSLCIAIITGGENNEREISFKSATAVKQGLTLLGYTQIGRYDFPQDGVQFVQDHTHKKIDFVFLMIHGAGGEDGQIASFLTLLGIRYQCTSPEVLALTMNKWHTKLVWRAKGIPVADDIVIVPNDYSFDLLHKEIQNNFGFPCVRKELDQGSSNGVHIIHTPDELQTIHSLYMHHTKSILIEEFLEGDEITIPLLDEKLGTKVLPLIHIIPPQEGGFDYENKYNGKTQEICPSGFSQEIISNINEIALKAYNAVGCTKYGRIDAILTKKGPVLLEINTIPGFTDQSLFPKSAQVYGLSFDKLLEHFITLSQ